MGEVDVETGERPVLFEHDGERHAWQQYAAAALGGMCNMTGEEELHSVPNLAAAVARVADAMLAEERKRRDPKTRRRGRR